MPWFDTVARVASIAALMCPLVPAAAQAPVPAQAAQHPSPMLESTRRHERLTPRALGGTVRAFPGPGGKPVELWVPDRARTRDACDVVIHFHGAAWTMSSVYRSMSSARLPNGTLLLTATVSVGRVIAALARLRSRLSVESRSSRARHYAAFRFPL